MTLDVPPARVGRDRAGSAVWQTPRLAVCFSGHDESCVLAMPVGRIRAHAPRSTRTSRARRRQLRVRAQAPASAGRRRARRSARRPRASRRRSAAPPPRPTGTPRAATLWRFRRRRRRSARAQGEHAQDGQHVDYWALEERTGETKPRGGTVETCRFEPCSAFVRGTRTRRKSTPPGVSNECATIGARPTVAAVTSTVQVGICSVY